MTKQCSIDALCLLVLTRMGPVQGQGAGCTPGSTAASISSPSVDRAFGNLDMGNRGPGEASTSASGGAGQVPSGPSLFRNARVSNAKLAKLSKLLQQQVIDLDDLRDLSWSGLPSELRPTCWKHLLSYLPLNR